MTSIFERYLSMWVLLCIVAGVLLCPKYCPYSRRHGHLREWRTRSLHSDRDLPFFS